jgi:hypothetical protein
VFQWRFLDQEGKEIGSSEAFDARPDAEEWMGTAWSGLLSSGVEQVELVDEQAGRTLYRMGLRAQ